MGDAIELPHRFSMRNNLGLKDSQLSSTEKVLSMGECISMNHLSAHTTRCPVIAAFRPLLAVPTPLQPVFPSHGSLSNTAFSSTLLHT